EDCQMLVWVGLQAGQVEDAVRAYRDAAAVWKQLADARPTDPVARELAGMAFNDLGYQLHVLGRFDQADQAYAEAQAILADREKPAPAEVKFEATRFVPRRWNGWVFVQANRASLRLSAGHPEEAAEAYRQRVEWFRRRVTAAPPGAAADRQKVAEAQRQLGFF